MRAKGYEIKEQSGAAEAAVENLKIAAQAYNAACKKSKNQTEYQELTA